VERTEGLRLLQCFDHTQAVEGLKSEIETSLRFIWPEKEREEAYILYQQLCPEI
jgi:hypothetical protein